MPKQYFIKRGSKISGPFSTDEVRKRVTGGQIRTHDGIAYGRSGPWRRVSDIPTLAACSAPADSIDFDAAAAEESVGRSVDLSYRVRKPFLSKSLKVIYTCHQCNAELINPLADAGQLDNCAVCGSEHRVPGTYEKSQQVPEPGQSETQEADSQSATTTSLPMFVENLLTCSVYSMVLFACVVLITWFYYGVTLFFNQNPLYPLLNVLPEAINPIGKLFIALAVPTMAAILIEGFKDRLRDFLLRMINASPPPVQNCIQLSATVITGSIRVVAAIFSYGALGVLLVVSTVIVVGAVGGLGYAVYWAMTADARDVVNAWNVGMAIIACIVFGGIFLFIFWIVLSSIDIKDVYYHADIDGDGSPDVSVKL